jgi:ubiquinone/menaquinone biosynthesis C-methylase UbiE
MSSLTSHARLPALADVIFIQNRVHDGGSMMHVTRIGVTSVSPEHRSRRGLGSEGGRLFLIAVLACLCVAMSRPASAQLAARAAEEWIKTLDSPNRVSSMKITEMVQALKIKPGQTVADVGAGSGTVSGPLALATGPTGVMYAVDIDQGLLTHIAQRAADQRIGNIKTVLGEFKDPKLPEQVDLAFINDVLHHIEDPATYLKSLASYLKPNGRIAIVDFTPERSPHRNQAELVVSEAKTEAWLQAAGLKLSEKVQIFDDRFYVIYAKP